MSHPHRWLQAAGLVLLIAPGVGMVFLASAGPRAITGTLWVVILASALGLALLFLAQVSRSGAAFGNANWARPEASIHARVLLGALAPSAYLVMAAGITITRHGSILAGLLQALPMTSMFVGMGLVPLAFRRAGTTRYCARCNYEQSSHVTEDPHSHPKCPECGADWHGAHGIVVGERKIRRWVLVIAGALAVVPFLMSAARPLGLWGANLHIRVLPTGSLMKEVAGAPRGFVMDEWAVLAKRTLTPAQDAHLAEALLDRRDRNGYIDMDSEKWLAAKAAAGGLPPATVVRLYRDAVTVWIDAPSRARVGEPLSISLGVTERGGMSTGFGSPVAHILFAGFDAADQHAVSRSTAPGLASGFGRLGRHIDITTVNPTPGPTLTLAAPVPGPVRVQASYWLAYAPPGSLGTTITWNADGTPVLPASVLWSERRAIEATIQIDP